MSLSVFSQVPTRLRNDVIAIKGGDTLYFFVLDAYGNASIYGSQPLTIKNTDTLYFDDGSYMITAASADDTLWLPGQSGTASVRMSSDTATGNYAVAMGNNTTASGYASTAMGNTTIASGPYSTAMGNGTTASGAGSFAHGGGFLGLFTTASGDYSAAWGAQTTASGERSTAWGGQTTASGSYSTAMGNGTTASGVVSFATGVQTKALSLNETTFGRYNDTLNSTDASSWVATDNLFVVGNGADDANRNNAFAILKNGNATFDANVTVGDTLFLNSDTILGATDTTSLSNRIDQRWSLLGNAGTDTTTNFIGTTDNLGLYFRTNNTNKMLLNRDGKLGIGITPLANLHIAEAATGTHKENSFILGNVTNNWPAFGAVGIPGNSAFIFSRAGESNSAGYRIFQIGGNGTITMYYPNATQRLFISFDALANTQKFYGNLAVTLGMERHTTAATAGNNLTINAGGATSGATNKNGGMITLSPGVSTACGMASVRMQGFRRTHYTASGTTDNTAQDRFILASEKPLVDAANDTLFSVVLGADSMFFATISYSVYVSDDDSASGESGVALYSFVNNGAVPTSETSSLTRQALPTGVTLTKTLSTSYVRATSTLYILVNYNTDVHLSATEFIRMTYTVTNTGGRHGAITQF